MIWDEKEDSGDVANGCLYLIVSLVADFMEKRKGYLLFSMKMQVAPSNFTRKLAVSS